MKLTELIAGLLCTVRATQLKPTAQHWHIAVQFGSLYYFCLFRRES